MIALDKIIWLKNALKKKAVEIFSEDVLRNEINESLASELEKEEGEKGQSVNIPRVRIPSVSELRENVRRELNRMINESSNENIATIDVFNRVGYEKLADCLKGNGSINEDDPIWEKLWEEIKIDNPKFENTLIVLSNNQLDKIDKHILSLIRFHVRVTDMSQLLNLSVGGVSSRRMRMSEKIFGEKLPNKEFDKLIRLL